MMRARRSFGRYKPSGFAAIAAAFAAAAAATATVAQEPRASEPSVQSLIDSLSVKAVPVEATTRSFTFTPAPDPSTHLCPGGGRGRAKDGEEGTRNLEVVPYGGSGSPSVNLDLQFELASDRLSRGDQSQLTRLATALRSETLRDERFAVAGHTDTSGDERVNLQLSCARALAAQRFLIAQGISPARLTAYGFGSERLLLRDAPTDPKNRRVEIRKPPR